MSEDEEVKFYRDLGLAIREERKAANVSQEALAEAIGISRPSIVNIEGGRQGIALHRLYDIAFALSIPVMALLPQRDDQAEGLVSIASLRIRVRELERRLGKVRKALGDGELTGTESDA